MSVRMTWCYCGKCGRHILVGEKCFDIGEDTYCNDCCKEVDTQEEYEKRWYNDWR